MLNMLPTSDKKLLDKMSYEIFAKPFQGDIGYVFYNDGSPVGFARLIIGDTSVVSEVGVLPEHRRKGYGDFFTRSVLFRLIQISRTVKIAYKSAYYLPFGFTDEGDGMTIASEKLVFTQQCQHC